MILKDGVKFNIPKAFADQFVRPVVFQLVDGQGGHNMATNKLQFPVSRGILPFFTVRETDRQKGSGTVEYRYATAQRQIPGRPNEYEYNPPSIDFVKGQLVCDPANKNHLDLYWLLKNHSKNQDSQNLEGSPYFFEINPEKNAQDTVSKRTARHESENKILNEWSKDQLKEVAFAFADVSAESKSKAQLQEYLLDLVDRDPIGFHKQVESEDMILRSKIVEGMALKVISYDEANSTWNWGEDPARTDKSNTLICVVQAGVDPKTRLMIFFNRSIKSENVDYFLDRLNTVKNPVEEVKTA